MKTDHHIRFAPLGITLLLLLWGVNATAQETQNNRPAAGAEPVVTHTAVLVTDKGEIELELYGEDAPKTVQNFVGLAENDFYDGILFHRVVKNFVIQGGDPKSKDPAMRAQWGTGGESIYGEEFEDELDPDAPSSKRGYVEGSLAMANYGPNTNSSQFFIATKDISLPHSYTIFGYVSKGMDVVHAIEEGTGAPPKEPVTIIDVRITEHGEGTGTPPKEPVDVRISEHQQITE